MANENNNSGSLPPLHLALILGSVFGGGAGVSSLVQPQIQTQALQACYDNSRIAIDQADTQGRAIDDIRIQLSQNTRDRYYGVDARRDWDKHRNEHSADAEHENLQDRRIENLERETQR